MHFENSPELYAGSADVPSAARRQARGICYKDEIISRFALSADETSAFPAKSGFFLRLHQRLSCRILRLNNLDVPRPLYLGATGATRQRPYATKIESRQTT